MSPQARNRRRKQRTYCRLSDCVRSGLPQIHDDKRLCFRRDGGRRIPDDGRGEKKKLRNVFDIGGRPDQPDGDDGDRLLVTSLLRCANRRYLDKTRPLTPPPPPAEPKQPRRQRPPPAARSSSDQEAYRAAAVERELQETEWGERVAAEGTLLDVVRHNLEVKNIHRGLQRIKGRELCHRYIGGRSVGRSIDRAIDRSID